MSVPLIFGIDDWWMNTIVEHNLNNNNNGRLRTAPIVDDNRLMWFIYSLYSIKVINPFDHRPNWWLFYYNLSAAYILTCSLQMDRIHCTFYAMIWSTYQINIKKTTSGLSWLWVNNWNRFPTIRSYIAPNKFNCGYTRCVSVLIGYCDTEPLSGITELKHADGKPIHFIHKW